LITKRSSPEDKGKQAARKPRYVTSEIIPATEEKKEESNPTSPPSILPFMPSEHKVRFKTNRVGSRSKGSGGD
jgi:hypothetical protein